MNLLVPAALGTLALAGPLIVLYMLRSRRPRVPVGSTMLWTGHEEQVTSAVPWSPLRWSALLALQLIVLSLFAFSLARPFFSEATVLGPHSVIIIDTSGSMAEAGRFDRAIDQALALASDASEQNLVSVVEAGPIPRVLVSFAQGEADVVSALESLDVGAGEADLSGAIRLGRGLATPDRPTNVILFSDGGSSPLPEEPVVGLTHVWVDVIADDVSLETLSVEVTGGVIRALLTTANHATSARTVDVEIAVDGSVVDLVTFELAAGDRQVRTFPVAADPGSEIVATRVGDPDGNPLDDRIHAVVEQATVRGVRFEGGREAAPFVAALVEAIPGFEASDDGDVLVVDGGDLPDIDRPALIFRTARPPEGIEATGVVANVVATFQAPGEPVLDGVDLSELAIAEVQEVDARGWSPIVRSGDIPLVLLGSVNGHRAAYFTFDVGHSNLPVQIAFPVLGNALLEWLAGDVAAQVTSAPAGTPIGLTPPPGGGTSVAGPRGEPVALVEGATEFVDTDLPGVYRVTYTDSSGVVTQGPVAVRTFVAEEAGAVTREIPTAAPTGEADGAATLIREWGPLVVAVLLALLLVEWWVGHQRPIPWRAT